MEWIKVAQITDFADKHVIQVEADDELVAIYHLDGAYFAINDICSHAEAYLSEGEIEAGSIECPLHGAKFDIRSGSNQTLPAVTPVEKYDLKVENGDILIAIDE